MSKVTINDVALQSNVSIGTVYRAVNNTGRISEETRKRVLETVERLGYRANSVARGLALRSKFKILVIIPRRPNIFWDDVIKGTRKAASKLSEYGVEIIEFFHERGNVGTKTVMDAVSEQKVDAIVMSIVGLKDYRKALTYAVENTIPVAVFNEDTVTRERLFFYGPDNRLAGRMAAELMYKFCGRSGTYCIISSTNPDSMSDNTENTDVIRVQSFQDYLSRHCTDIHSAGTYCCTHAEVPLVIQQIINDYPGIKGFYFTQYSLLYHNYKMLSDLKKKYIVIGHEYNEEFKEALHDGTITALLKQEKVCQGYYPLLMIYNYLMTGEKPSRDSYFSNINIILDANVECLQYHEHGSGYE